MAASTGSPASRRLTKLTPLTTRPSFTSRQGMTRTLNILGRPRRANEPQRRRRVEPAIVECAADDGPFEFFRPRLKKCAHILKRGEPAGGDDRDRHRVGNGDRGIEVEALEHAVAHDVSVDDGGDAGVLETLGNGERRELGGLGPAFDRDFAVACIEADGDAPRKRLRCFLHQFWIAHSSSADDDAADAFAEPAFYCGAVA